MQPARADVVIRASRRELRVRERRDEDPGPLRQRPGDQPGRGRDHDGTLGFGQVDLADPDRRPSPDAGGKPRGPRPRPLAGHREGAGRAPQEHRFHLSAAQPVQLAHRDRERANGHRTAARQRSGDEQPVRRDPGQARSWGTDESSSGGALRRPETASRHRAGTGQSAGPGACRRTDGLARRRVEPDGPGGLAQHGRRAGRGQRCCWSRTISA